MLIWQGQASLYGNIFRKIPKKTALKIGKTYIEAGEPIPAGVLTPERIEQFKAQGQIKDKIPDVVVDDEPEEIQDKPKRGRRAGIKPKLEADDADNGAQG